MRIAKPPGTKQENDTILLRFLLVIISLFPSLVGSAVGGGEYECPNNCSNHGICSFRETPHKNRMCQCFPGWTGVDCSIRYCPAGTAWADVPYGNNLAHFPYTECSRMVRVYNSIFL